ncbi:hypothetical protein NI17_012790 [Thermobifida halotolerans]|uniref:Uncharacterized protein n=1 Tax=Thermobifida halotolerans TaxID=483545 RepID=A0AA97LTI3_9ACTN|nr:hypothetical protein [Thermobifida halotolerans]UOE17779.1 hypothetical protein NI17_012790 [Thermobifida halotolerans]
MNRPAELLATADTLLASPLDRSFGPMRRGTVFLLRKALEEMMREYWREVRPELAEGKGKTHAQSLCLGYRGHTDLAGRWSALWLGLSRACHYHQCPLPPSITTLTAWRDEVAALLPEFEKLSLAGKWEL